VFLDECVDWRLSREIVGHEVKTAHQMGWSAIGNGELLGLVAKEFDIFVIVDRNLSFQQNLPAFAIAGHCSPCAHESAVRSVVARPATSRIHPDRSAGRRHVRGGLTVAPADVFAAASRRHG
jgi:hypothetical protein